MADKQRTLANDISLSGHGLHSGKQVNVTIKPAEVNAGFQFKRVDLPEQPIIEASASLVSTTARGTTLQKGDAILMTIEHLLAALTGMDIDNALIEIDGSEAPILDGSSKYYVEAIAKVGVIEQEVDREYYQIREKISYTDEKGAEITIYPDDKFSIDVHIDYNSKVLGQQYASLTDMANFKDEIASCKTFVFLHELEALAAHNLIKGGDLENALVIIDKAMSQEELDRLTDLFHQPKIEVRPEGILNNTKLSFQNEPARHKLLDVIGDLALIGTKIKGKVIASKPGHYSNTELAKQIQKLIKKEKKRPVAPEYNPDAQPLYDINEIKKILPHRPPFLLIDKITSLEGNVVTGIKNVTMNETFFVGHFPDEPVMPGVLQIEAMAQCGAVLILSQLPDPENYVMYFMKIQNIKFKQKVVPGDTLNIRMTLIEPLKRGIALTKGHIFVGDSIAVEGEFMAQLAKTKN